MSTDNAATYTLAFTTPTEHVILHGWALYDPAGREIAATFRPLDSREDVDAAQKWATDALRERGGHVSHWRPGTDSQRFGESPYWTTELTREPTS